MGDEKAVTADQMRTRAARIGLDDADVIFLGGRAYAELLTASVPHTLTPLTGGLGAHRGMCKQAREDAALRGSWWKDASALFDKHHTAS